ncbi:MAG: PAS domain S-box protein, partial [Chloroflexi bacterium]|nr:PAS domain S-box protein [Chloroflexota bacterium]
PQPVGALPHAQEVLESRAPVIIADTVADSRWLRRPESEYIRCWLGVPLVAQDRVIGLLNLDKKQPDFYTQRDAELAVAFANQAAVAIENARLYEAVQQELAEREQAEKETRRLKEFNESIVQNMFEGIAVEDAEGYFSFVNPAAAAMLGYAPDELLGQHWTIIVPPSQQPIVQAADERRARGETDQYELELVRKNGTRFSVLISGNPHFEGGRFAGTLAVFTDITERKRAEEALEQRAAQLTLLSDVGGRIAAVMDLDSMLDRTARLVQESFGYHHVGLFTLDRERDEMVMKTKAGDFTALFPLDHRLKVGQGMVGWAALHGETLLANDVNANPRYVNLYPGVIMSQSELCVPIRVGEEVVGVLDIQSTQLDAFDENDVLVIETLADQIAVAIENARLYEAVQQELAERQRVEREIEERRLYLEGVLAAAPDAIVTLDAHHRIVEWNPGAERLFGYPREEAIGQDIDLLITDPDTFEEASGYTQVVISGKDLLPVETVRYRKDGSPVDAIVAGSPILVGDELIGLAAAYTDITERKRAEEQLQHYAAELEQTNEEVKQFAYIVSHDLRAPLVNLKGFAAELRAALAVIGSAMITTLPHLDERRRQSVTMALEEDVPEALGFIDSSVTRMDSFINAVLKLSRLGRRELKLEPVDMNALVQATLQTLAHQIEECKVSMTVGSLPEVIADRTSMEQVLGNLLNNAVIYLDPDRPGEIEITAECEHDKTMFHVRDNGRGIAERDMDKVFAPFRRAGSQDVPGEGMGLPYVQTLVRRHGGRIWVESEPGKGSTFYFTIPTNVERKT